MQTPGRVNHLERSAAYLQLVTPTCQYSLAYLAVRPPSDDLRRELQILSGDDAAQGNVLKLLAILDRFYKVKLRGNRAMSAWPSLAQRVSAPRTHLRSPALQQATCAQTTFIITELDVE